ILVLANNQSFAQHRNVHVRPGHRTVVVGRTNPHWRYVNAPRRGVVVTSAPRAAIGVTYGGVGYNYHQGIFYRRYGRRYIVTAPPIGIRVHTLPVGYTRVVIADRPYYYYYGTYYLQNDNEYEVSKPPLGAVVESIPDGYEIVQINGDTYYRVDGVQYKAVTKDGEIWYEVVNVDTNGGSPSVGSLVRMVPEGSEKVIIDGNTYYTSN